MFWESEAWREIVLDDGGWEPVRAMLAAGLQGRKEARHFARRTLEAPLPPARDGGPLDPDQLRVRPVRFWPDCWLYELRIVDQPWPEENYRWACVYAVVAKERTADSPWPATAAIDAGPPHEALDARWSVTLIDWESSTIHGLNERLGVVLEQAGESFVGDYVDFFTSFVSGESGSPFMVITGGTLQAPIGVQRSALAPFADVVAAMRGFDRLVPPVPPPWFPVSATDPDAPDFGPDCPAGDRRIAGMRSTGWTPDAATPGDAGRGESLAAAGTSSASGSDVGGTTVPAQSQSTLDVVPAMTVTARGDGSWHIDAIVLYGRSFSTVTFSVAATPAPGVRHAHKVDIAMLEDAPLADPHNPILAIFTGAIDISGLRYLVHDREREIVDAPTFERRIKGAPTGRGAPEGEPGTRPRSSDGAIQLLRNLRVIGPVRLPGGARESALTIRDCEFSDDVSLEEEAYTTSVRFEQSVFGGIVGARNCSVDGDLEFQSCRFLGANPDFVMAVDFRGAIVTGDVNLSGSAMYSRPDKHKGRALKWSGQAVVDGSKARVEGGILLHGLEIVVEPNGGEEVGALRLRGARVTGEVTLEPRGVLEGLNGPRAWHRSRVGGPVDLGALAASGVALCGAVMGSLTMDQAQVGGVVRFDMHYFETPSGSATEDAPCAASYGQRVLVVGDADLRALRATDLWLGGAALDGSLTLTYSRIANMITAGLAAAGYRFRVGRDVTLSGAEIGELELSGMLAVGDLEMATGHVGRLFLEAQPFWCCVWQPARSPQRFRFEVAVAATSVATITLSGVKGLSKLGLAGVQVGQRPGDSPRGDLSLARIEVDGEVELYRGTDAWARVVTAIKAPAQDGRQMPSPPPTRIAGDLWMRAVSTTGSLDLTDSVVGRRVAAAPDTAHVLHDRRSQLEAVAGKGRVLLNDLQVGTDLYARCSSGRGAHFATGSDPALLATSDPDCGRLALDCTLLDVDNATVGGDAYLAGVRIRRGTEVPSCAFTARNLSVGGRVELVAKNGIALTQEVPTPIELSGLEADELWLRGTTTEREARPVVLQRAKMGKVVVHDPVPLMELEGAGIGAWERVRTDAAGVRTELEMNAEAYIELLQSQPPGQQDRSVWTAVEAQLRNEASQADADAVYRAMRAFEERARRTGSVLTQLWWGLRSLVFGTFAGYGTRVGPASTLVLAASVGLYGVLRHPENVAASDGLLLQMNIQCATLESPQITVDIDETVRIRCAAYRAAIAAAPDPQVEFTAASAGADYNGSDALRLTSRYAIPFLSALSDLDWVPVEQRGLTLPGPAGSRLPISPAMVAFFAQLLNTIAVSAIGVFIGNRLFRK